jgi:hypothetical protein
MRFDPAHLVPPADAFRLAGVPADPQRVVLLRHTGTTVALSKEIHSDAGVAFGTALSAKADLADLLAEASR